MEDESSKKKKKAMGLNQLHNRFLTASSHSKSSAAYGFLSEMKNPEQRQHDYDGPSFDFDSDSDSGSDSPCSAKTLENDTDGEKVLSVERSGGAEETKSLENDTDEEKVSSFELFDDCEKSVCIDESAINGLDYSSSDGAEKVVSKVMNEDEFESVKQVESRESFGEPVGIIEDDVDSQQGDRHQKVKIHGRRRLCKVVVNDDDEEHDKFHDVESEFSAVVADFDSPSPAKNTANKSDGGDEIRDILSNLSSKFEFLSIEKGKRPAKQLSTSSDSFTKESLNEHKPVKVSERIDVEKTSFSSASNRYDSSPKATATRKENINTGYVKNHVRKAVATESSVHLQKSKNVKADDDDDDDDDCVVTSGQKFVQKVEGRHDVSSTVYTLTNESNDSTSRDEVPFSLRNPKFNFSLPSKIANMLYPHQREGLKWLWSLHCKGKGGILGDDMGLGKTMQICGFLAGLFHSKLIKRVLVVAPKTLLPHWMKELGVVNLSRITREFFGTCSKARQYELQYVLQDKGVLLTTYDIVRNNVKALSGDYDEMEDDAVTWDYMILDEGHLIKNPSTQRAKSLLAIPCAHRIIISGTPLQNNLKELWALFNFCCPELLGDKKCFKDKYESAILRGNDKNASERDKRIGSAVAQDLRNCIQPYFLRRLKSEVFREDGGNTNTAKLSKKNEIIVWLRLSRCQRQLYEAFLKSEIVLSAFDGSPLAAITILKKICDHPLLLTKRAAEDVLEGMESDLNQEDHGVAEKLAMHIADVADKYDIRENNDILSCKISFIVSLLDNLIPEGHHVLIFSQTRKMLNLIQDAINAQGYKFLRIDGTTKASDRLKIVNDFQEGVGAPPIFLLTSQVGGLGLTLTKADRVIVADPAWNPSTDNQSVDRAYRIGQTKDVLVYRLMTCGTVEEKIYRKQIYKGGLFRSATEQKEQIRYFSAQDLRELFSLPKQGFDVSLTQQQLHEEHDSEHTMDPSLKVHTKFLESLGIAGISHHSLLFSRTAPVQPVAEEELTRIRQSTYVGHSTSRSLHEQNVDASAQFAVNPKDIVRRTHHSPNISNKLTESEIKQQINRLSQIYANKAMVARLGDNGAKIQKQISELNSELNKLRLSKTGEIETVDLSDDFNRVINI
ncbi:protein CHROMATIN REMODELING 24 isoform X3 [Helianthus annuus]|uniref:protein CHROMATIN REMODELING 24 isoform X3 n=1 Tax=Helianthus annuus TaxID=4232 RepID=UPI000B8F1E96|nr:protein CHROMATIN REMODELING 24 isoform X3 [Helianthus annuus]